MDLLQALLRWQLTLNWYNTSNLIKYLYKTQTFPCPSLPHHLSIRDRPISYDYCDQWRYTNRVLRKRIQLQLKQSFVEALWPLVSEIIYEYISSVYSARYFTHFITFFCISWSFFTNNFSISQLWFFQKILHIVDYLRLYFKNYTCLIWNYPQVYVTKNWI